MAKVYGGFGNNVSVDQILKDYNGKKITAKGANGETFSGYGQDFGAFRATPQGMSSMYYTVDDSEQQALDQEANRVRIQQGKDADFSHQVDLLRTEREKDLDRGRERGKEVFGDGSLGRLGGAGGPMQDIIDRRRAFLTGYSPEEMNAQRDSVSSANDQATVGGLRQLRGEQARAGMTGAAAVAQRARLLEKAGEQEHVSERELFNKQTDLKRSALDSYENTVGGTAKFDLEQAMREKMGQLSTELGYGSLGSSDRGLVMSRVIGQEQLEAAQAAANSGGKK